MLGIPNIFKTILARTQKLRGRCTLTATLYTFVGLVFFTSGVTATNAYITSETPKEFLARLTQSTSEEPEVEETFVLGVEETEEEPTCGVEELNRKCVGCYRAEVTKQKEDCTTYTEIVDDQSCAVACPQPTPTPVAPQQPAAVPTPTVQQEPAPALAPTPTPAPEESTDETKEETEEEKKETEEKPLVPVSTKSLGLVYVKEEFVGAVRDLDKLAGEYLTKANECIEKCWDAALKKVPETQEELDRNLEKLHECNAGCKFYTEKNTKAVGEILALVNKSK